MTAKQKIEIRLSEVRTRLNEIAGLEGDGRTEEIRSEQTTLTTEFTDLEERHRAAIISDPETEVTDDAEGRELRALTEGPDAANVGAIYTAAVEHRQTDGREAELQQHFKLAGNQIPLSMLRTEHRTTGVTPAPGSVGATQAAIVPGVFPMSMSAFLGVEMPTVGVGDAVFPVMAANATVRTPAEGAEAVFTTGSFSGDALTPSRLQASFFHSLEDRARFVGMGEALRQNLGDALGDGLDKQVISGPNGLLNGANIPNRNVTVTTSYALYRSGLLFGRVDGKYAGEASDIRIVMGTDTHAHAASIYRSTESDSSALDLLQRDSGGVRVSAHVPASSNNKQNVLVRLGLRQDMVAAVWEGISLFVDEATLIDEGELKITAVMLYAVKILRAGGFYKQQTLHV